MSSDKFDRNGKQFKIGDRVSFIRDGVVSDVGTVTTINDYYVWVLWDSDNCSNIINDGRNFEIISTPNYLGLTDSEQKFLDHLLAKKADNAENAAEKELDVFWGIVESSARTTITTIKKNSKHLEILLHEYNKYQ